LEGIFVSENGQVNNMMFPPQYEGGRKITVGIYGTYKFSKNAEKILREDYGHPIGEDLAKVLASPEMALGFKEYVMSNPDFKVASAEPREFVVKTSKNSTTKLLNLTLLSQSESLEELADEGAARRREFLTRE